MSVASSRLVAAAICDGWPDASISAEIGTTPITRLTIAAKRIAERQKAEASAPIAMIMAKLA